MYPRPRLSLAKGDASLYDLCRTLLSCFHVPSEKGHRESDAPSGPKPPEPPSNAKDPSTFSLVEAAQYGILERCRHLVENEGADVTKGDAEGITVLHWAAINNRLPVARCARPLSGTSPFISSVLYLFLPPLSPPPAATSYRREPT